MDLTESHGQSLKGSSLEGMSRWMLGDHLSSCSRSEWVRVGQSE